MNEKTCCYSPEHQIHYLNLATRCCHILKSTPTCQERSSNQPTHIVIILFLYFHTLRYNIMPHSLANPEISALKTFSVSNTPGWRKRVIHEEIFVGNFKVREIQFRSLNVCSRNLKRAQQIYTAHIFYYCTYLRAIIISLCLFSMCPQYIIRTLIPLPQPVTEGASVEKDLLKCQAVIYKVSKLYTWGASPSCKPSVILAFQARKNTWSCIVNKLINFGITSSTLYNINVGRYINNVNKILYIRTYIATQPYSSIDGHKSVH